MRWIVPSFLALLLLTAVSAVAAPVRVCIYDNAPLGFMDPSGTPRGLLPDLLHEVAREKDWSLEYQAATWQICLEKLESGTIDILPVIAYTPQRAQKFRFAEETVMTNWGQVYQRPGERFDSIPALAGRQVAVLAGDVHYLGSSGLAQTAEKFGVNIEFIEVASYLEAFSLLARGEVDAALTNRLFGLQHLADYGLQATAIQLNPIQIRPAFSLFSPPSLKAEFDQALSGWKQAPDSIFYQLVDRWLQIKSYQPFPIWLRYLMYFLSALLLTMILMTLWARRQVRRKTDELEKNHRQLEDELVERLSVEKELRERQQQYQVLFEDSQSMILLIDPATATIVDANPSACAYYQYPRETMQGMSISRLNGLPEEDIRERITQIEARELQHTEMQHRLANGEVRDIELQCTPILIEGRSLICSIMHDISKRKKAERELEERNRFLQSVIDGVSDPLMVIGLDYQVLKMNRSAREQVTEAHANGGFRCYEISHASQVPCSGDDHPCPLKKVQETGEAVTMIHHHISRRGRRIIELNASPLYDSAGELMAVIEVARDVTERMQVEALLNENEKRLHHLAHHDPLTDLPNRLLFEDRIKQALSKARRSRKQVALFFLDLDHFKDINDNLGHAAGDLLLIDIANRLKNSVRESDTVARMGGDEFLVLLDEVESVEMVEAMAERICQSLAHELTRDTYHQRVSASIGISLFPDDGMSSQELLRNADQAMYRAKNQGKATYQFYNSSQTGFLF